MTPGSAMEILPGLHSLPAATGAFMGTYDPNVYLMLGQREGVLIDAGLKDEAQVQARLKYLKELGEPRVSYLVITHAHPDHIGGAAALKAATGARVVVHRLDEARANEALGDTKVNLSVEDGQVLALDGLELELIHAPGHSPGHLCPYWRERRVLFSGDNVLGVGTTAINPQGGSMAQYMDSLRKLMKYEVSLICPGHGPLVRQPRQKLEELVQHRLEREEQVLDCLRRGIGRIESMAKEIYPELDRRLWDWAKSQVLAHLLKLEAEGRVVVEGEGEEKEYRLRS